MPAVSEARLFFLIQWIITNRCLLKSIFDSFRFTQFLENYNKREANLENSAGNFISRKMLQTKARYGKLKQMLINFKGTSQSNKVFWNFDRHLLLSNNVSPIPHHLLLARTELADDEFL